MDPPREFISSSPFKNDQPDSEFSFVVSDHHNEEISGQMQSTTDDSPQKSSNFFDNGAAKLFKARGIGWLLEVENVGDEAFEKPLL